MWDTTIIFCEWGKSMKRFIAKYGHFLAALALFVSVSTNSFLCAYVFYQPVLPDSVKKLRKF